MLKAKIDPKLEEFKGRILFPKKMNLANKLLDNAQLPKDESQNASDYAK